MSGECQLGTSPAAAGPLTWIHFLWNLPPSLRVTPLSSEAGSVLTDEPNEAVRLLQGSPLLTLPFRSELERGSSSCLGHDSHLHPVPARFSHAGRALGTTPPTRSPETQPQSATRCKDSSTDAPTCAGPSGAKAEPYLQGYSEPSPSPT